MAESTSLNNRTLNRLRAAVLGANDGIVSTSSVVMGVAGAGANNKAIFTAGLAALVAGAMSMGVGEYVSVGSQKDAEMVHVEKEHGGDDSGHEFTSPSQAAIASLISFTLGGIIPFFAIVLAPATFKVGATIIAVLVSLFITGYLSARVSGASWYRSIFRVVIGGMLAMGITYYIGTLFGTAFG